MFLSSVIVIIISESMVAAIFVCAFTYIIIPPKNKVLGGYIGVTVSGCMSVGRSVKSHILSGLFLTNHWVEFNKNVHEASIPRGDMHTLKILQLHVI